MAILMHCDAPGCDQTAPASGGPEWFVVMHACAMRRQWHFCSLGHMRTRSPSEWERSGRLQGEEDS